MALTSFEQQVIAWQRKAEAAMTATLKEAAQDLTEKMLTPKAKGGRMGVDTGALRNSFAGAVNSIPRGPSTPEGVPTDFDLQPLVLAINRVKLGDRLAIGTAMNYGKYHEAQTAFVRANVQNWDTIAAQSARKVRRAIG
jgi:hypothetical protein